MGGKTRDVEGRTGGLGLYKALSESAHIQIWSVLIQREGLGAVQDGTVEAPNVVPTYVLEITPDVQWEGYRRSIEVTGSLITGEGYLSPERTSCNSTPLHLYSRPVTLCYLCEGFVWFGFALRWGLM